MIERPVGVLDETWQKFLSECAEQSRPAKAKRKRSGNGAEDIEGGTETIIDADPVATAIRDFMATRSEWEGIAAELLAELSGIVPERVTKSRPWPDTARAMSGRLRRAADLLRKVGLDISFPTGHYRGRIFTLSHRLENIGTQPSRPSSPSSDGVKDIYINDLCQDGSREHQDGRTVGGTVAASARTIQDGRKIVPSRSDPLKNNENNAVRDGEDGRDGSPPYKKKKEEENEWKGSA